MKEIAPDIALISLKIANVYLIGTDRLWFLVDSGLPGEQDAIVKAAAQRFGAKSKPAAIVLTHGHPDHSGSARALAERWKVQVYAHRLELPFLSGLSPYPPPDPTSPGLLSFLSRFFPSPTITLTPHLSQLNESDPFPGLSGWQTIPTPGHSLGQVAFLRQSDGALLAGDAFSTMNMESLIGVLSKRPQLCRPPVPSTINWLQTKDSVARLAEAEPKLLLPGHGKPMSNVGNMLKKFAGTMEIPSRGRYVQQPVTVNTNGFLSIPPEPPDYLLSAAKSVAIAGLAIGVGAVYPKLRSRIPRRP